MKFNKLIILIGFMIISFSYNMINSYALENTTIYATNTNGSLGNSGYLNYWKENGGLFSAQLNVVNADTSWGMYFFINKASAVGKVYKVRLNFNDYDFLKSVNASYIQVVGYNGSENVGTCNVLSFSLLNQGGSNNQAKGVEFTYNCLEPSNYKYIGIIKYDDNNNRLRTTTISWRLNNVQWEEVEDTQAQQIIINQTQNTNTIINNQNENTQNIINNQNEIAEQQHNDQLVCKQYDKSSIEKNGYLWTDGSENAPTSTLYGISSYISLTDTATLKILVSNNSDNFATCFYNTNKTLISCVNTNSYQPNSIINIPQNTEYVRFTINKSSNKPTFEICKNGNQAISDSVNDLNDTINDDSPGGATSEAGDFITGFDTNTFGLTSIITAPLNLIESLTSKSCSQLELPLPFLDNIKLTLPCMTTIYQNTFGSLFTLYQTITFGIIAYWVCVRIFNMVKDFKNPDHDEVEVVEL